MKQTQGGVFGGRAFPKIEKVYILVEYLHALSYIKIEMSYDLARFFFAAATSLAECLLTC